MSTVDLEQALVDAVDMVNRHAGETCVWLRFGDDPAEIDFIANSARLLEGRFEFQAGIETLAGSIQEITGVRTQVISH